MSVIDRQPFLSLSQSSNNLWYLDPSTAMRNWRLSDLVLDRMAECNWYLFIHASCNIQDQTWSWDISQKACEIQKTMDSNTRRNIIFICTCIVSYIDFLC